MAATHREAITIRVPSRLLESARSVKTQEESLNSLLIVALEREIRRRESEAIMDRIEQHSRSIRERFGVHTDSVPLLRQLREGEARND